MFQDSEVLTNFQLGEIITTDYLQCITGYDPVNERNVISFRGSVNVDNFLSTNFDTIPEPYPHASQLTDPKIHPGFYDAGTEVWYNDKRWWWQIDPMVYRVCDGSGEDSNCWGTDFWIDRLPVLSHHLEYFGLYDMSSGESYTILCAQKGDDE